MNSYLCAHCIQQVMEKVLSFWCLIKTPDHVKHPSWIDIYPELIVGPHLDPLDSLGGPFPTSSHRCHHKPKRCLPLPQCGSLASFPLLFHPSAKGSQIIMDLAQRTVKRQGSFCNAITFSNRPIAVYEQVRLKVCEP